jgi:hypothetical protein
MTEVDTTISEPLPDWVERIVDHAFQRHLAECPLTDRVQKIEIRFAALVGYMVGSGLLGGLTGALITGGVSRVA